MPAMRFYDLEGMVYCKDCRDGLLPILKPRDFEAVGDRPWAGNEAPYRYIQCDGCMGQWGPDA